MMTFNSVPQTSKHTPWRLLAEFSLPLSQHIEVEVILQLSKAADELRLPIKDWKRLQAAVATAILTIKEKHLMQKSKMDLTIRVHTCEPDDIAFSAPPAGLTGSQGISRGWGFFLVERMEADQQLTQVVAMQVIELFIYLE